MVAVERGVLLAIPSPYSVVCFSFQSSIVSCDSNSVHHKITTIAEICTVTLSPFT